MKKKYDEKTLKKIIRLKDEGRKYQEIADLCAMNKNTVAGIIYRHNHPRIDHRKPCDILDPDCKAAVTFSRDCFDALHKLAEENHRSFAHVVRRLCYYELRKRGEVQ